MAEEISTVKKSRVRKVAATPITTTGDIAAQASGAASKITKSEPFISLIAQISIAKEEFEKLQKEIQETKEAWVKEQKDHMLEVEERSRAEDLKRKREEESYLYELSRERKKAEDEFSDKKTAWEKQLQEQKEVIEKDRLDLEGLRKLTSNFDDEKEKTVQEAKSVLQKELTEKFDFEKRLREQEIKSEKEILNLKISSLSVENSKQAAEIEHLKKSLEDTTRQVREIAVKVIEAGSSTAKAPSISES